MEKSIKFLGIMILISSLIISLGGIIENVYGNRYYFSTSGNNIYVGDRLKGSVYIRSSGKFYTIDYPNKEFKND
jgi:hypothetical protein